MTNYVKTISFKLFFTFAAIYSFAALGLLLPLAAFAQSSDGPEPPRLDTTSETGVSYGSGSFSYNEIDLKIGTGDFPQALTLNRTYNSAAKPTSYDGLPMRGWSSNLGGYIYGIELPPLFPLPPEFCHNEATQHSLAVGNRSIAFRQTGCNSQDATGPFEAMDSYEQWGTLQAISSTKHIYIDKAGNELTFSNLSGFRLLTDWVAPDGTHLEYTYVNQRLKSVFSNRGWAILFDISSSRWAKGCTVNRAETYVAQTSNCPLGAPSVTFGYTGDQLTSVTDSTSKTTTYQYNAQGNLSCVKEHGQSNCKISNTYGACTRSPKYSYEPAHMNANQQVRSQTTAEGETYQYSFPVSRECPDPHPLKRYETDDVTVTTSVGSYRVRINAANLPIEFEDELGRVRKWEYASLNYFEEPVGLVAFEWPEGDGQQITRDTRGNITEQRFRAKPMSGLADRIWQTSYLDNCTSSNRKICNQPNYMIDANGNRTDFTYDPVHGGMLTATGPAVNGIRPQTRYTYAQRYAWIKNSSGGYVRAASPIWVLTQKSSCQTTAVLGAGCVGGVADEVKTLYDYGPDSGPNNLLRRGMAAVADGQTLRSCYTYDANGRQTSETPPRANLSACP